jgi:uncharacterized protein YdeI (YjbR/CyaY-like superfamily)
MKPVFFPSPAAFWRWLARNHGRARELWVGYHRRETGVPSMTWPESVDEALCFGWIDGVRRSLDERRYVIRFTPRRERSRWSAVNLARMKVLEKAGRVHPAGRAAWADRDVANSGYSIRNRTEDIPPALLRKLKAERAAWNWFRTAPPHYRRSVANWLSSAKREDTRLRRLAKLIEFSSRGLRIPPFTPGARR